MRFDVYRLSYVCLHAIFVSLQMVSFGLHIAAFIAYGYHFQDNHSNMKKKVFESIPSEIEMHINAYNSTM